MNEVLKQLEARELHGPEDLRTPLVEEAAQLLRSILAGARDNWDRDHHLAPVFFKLKNHQAECGAIMELTPENKPAVFNWMHGQVIKSDACAFISEVWYCQAMKSEYQNGPNDFLLMPSERADRKEMVMLILWVKDRRLDITAEIARNPDTLGPWMLIGDTADESFKAKDVGQMVGVPFEGRRQ